MKIYEKRFFCANHRLVEYAIRATGRIVSSEWVRTCAWPTIEALETQAAKWARIHGTEIDIIIAGKNIS